VETSKRDGEKDYGMGWGLASAIGEEEAWGKESKKEGGHLSRKVGEVEDGGGKTAKVKETKKAI